MTSRRRLLAGIGTLGVAGLAGCSGLPVLGSDDEREYVDLPPDAAGSIEWPDSPFPVDVPGRLADDHRERAEALLAEVPTDPSVPNGAVAEELRADRERAAERIDDGVEEPWPTDGLDAWRSRRNDAAALFGAYRAATGEDDADEIESHRRGVRSALGSLAADHEYRASSTLEAVLAHEPIEGLLADCRRRTRPDPAYPDDPVAHPFRAGDAVGRVDLARATLADAGRLRAVYLNERDDPPSQWSALIDASDRLAVAVSRTRATVRDFLDVYEPPFRADLDGTPARALFRRASGQVSASTDDQEERRDDGDYATAVIEAGQALAAVEALRAAIEGIRDGAYQDPVSVESVEETADRARDAIAAIEGSEDARLAARLARPAFGTFEYLPEYIEDGYIDAARAQGDLAWAELYARAVPPATAFVVERLE
ncbi:hypothetical protein [Halobellus rufus]|uniref:hypothetical protein n=1 Tax=Halobellus rufus TaxID=1448860 RepID=UPI000678AAF2|nr:hypothetical protein [Halobellus rufus]